MASKTLTEVPDRIHRNLYEGCKVVCGKDTSYKPRCSFCEFKKMNDEKTRLEVQAEMLLKKAKEEYERIYGKKFNLEEVLEDGE